MTTTYYVVPADRFFGDSFEAFGNRKMAEDEIKERAENGDETEYGIYEVKLVAGAGKSSWGRKVHIRDGRKIAVYRDPGNEWVAYDDNYGEEASSLYGHGRTEEGAIEECLDLVTDYESRVAAKRAAQARAA